MTRGLQFLEMPKSVLENYRVLNIAAPDLHVLAKFYCALLGLGGIGVASLQGGTAAQYAHKIICFMSTISELYFANFQKRLNCAETKSEQFTGLVTMKSVIQVMRSALEMVRAKLLQDEEVIAPFDALKASFDLLFKGLLSPDMFELYHQIFQQFFIQDKSSLIVAELIESRRFLDPIREYFIINKMDLHE